MGVHYQKVAVRTILVQPCTYAKVDLRLFEPFGPSQGVHKVVHKMSIFAMCSQAVAKWTPVEHFVVESGLRGFERW